MVIKNIVRLLRSFHYGEVGIMAVQEPTQRNFAVMGDNTFTIANRLMQNQKICRLLKYPVRDPFNKDKYADVDGADLINKQILIIPKIFDDDTEKTSYITAIFNNFTVTMNNPEFKLATIRFDIACPYEEWLLDEHTLRPYAIMQEVDSMFNDSKMAGIGKVHFYSAEPLTLTPWLGGYSMYYKVHEFN